MSARVSFGWFGCGLALALTAAAAATPLLPHPWEIDADGNGLDDRLDARIEVARRFDARLATDEARAAAQALRTESLRLEVLLREPATQELHATVESAGARVLHMFEHVAHGWLVELPLEHAEELARALGPKLLAIVIEEPVVLHAAGAEAGEPVSVAALDETDGNDVLVLASATGGRPGPATLAKAATLWQRGVPVFLNEDAELARAAAEVLTTLRARARAESSPATLVAELRELLAVARTGDAVDLAAAREAAGRQFRAPERGEFVAEGSSLFLRAVEVRAGVAEYVRLDVPRGADFDLEVRGVHEDAAPTPPYERFLRAPVAGARTVAESSRRGEGIGEALLLRAETDGRVWIVVRRIAGNGAFRLTTGPPATPTPEASEVAQAPTPAPREATGGVAPTALAPNPRGRTLEENVRVDGVGSDMGPVAVWNDSAPEGGIALANLRIGHDNDFLYMHLAMRIEPMTAAPAVWVLCDARARQGVNPLTPVPAPFGAAQGLAGTTLEPGLRVDSAMVLEGSEPGGLALWQLDYGRGQAQRWGALRESGGGWRFEPAANAPIGLSVALDNRGGFEVPGDARAADTGLELRVPLSALGFEAPLFAGTPRQELRLLVGTGDARTGAWSNQVLAPVGKDRPLGGGVGRTPPNFATNQSENGPFSGTQAMTYAIDYVEQPWRVWRRFD
ncbi:MAG: hypothetical protein KF858_00125 [Candidatus Sumerlaeia bacterium]|nr:hypothetical protein [Candidatus Sumerlaeia bacterium]